MISLLTSLGSTIGAAAGTTLSALIIVIILAWAIGMLFIIPTVAVITWTVKKVWYHNNNRNRFRY